MALILQKALEGGAQDQLVALALKGFEGCRELERFFVIPFGVDGRTGRKERGIELPLPSVAHLIEFLAFDHFLDRFDSLQHTVFSERKSCRHKQHPLIILRQSAIPVDPAHDTVPVAFSIADSAYKNITKSFGF
ncbi:MAG: hypothetical protein IJK24_01485 [Oscillospiraceae bacterium]|nr:hypothetical protein [Oscillospiraceae bacterium]MBQ6159597.1 hypothetical protein [Oscillospiraceae bacterium]